MILIPMLIAVILRLLPIPHVFGDVIRFNSVDAYYYVNGTKAWSYIIGSFPDVYAAAAILPVIFTVGIIGLCYLIAQELFNNKRISLFSALLLSIMSGEFLVRTSLGAGDTHALEILLLTLSIYCVIKILKNDNNRLLYIISLFITVIIYALIWQGWLLVLFIMIMAVCLKILITAKKWYLYILFTGGLLFGADMLALLSPDFARSALSVFQWNTTNTIYEAQPLFIYNGHFDIRTMFSSYWLCLCFLPGLLILEKSNKNIVFITWLIVVLLMTLAQRRFGYYLAVPLSILTVHTVWYIFQLPALRTNYRRILLIGLLSIPLLVGSVRQNMSDILYMPESWVETSQYLKEQPKATVLTWWDYGYWIKDTGHDVLDSPGRTVDSNYQYKPTNEIARMLAGIDEVKADYIIIDEAMVTVKLDHIMKFASVEDCIGLLLCRLYNDEQIDGYQQVFTSQDGKVKVWKLRN